MFKEHIVEYGNDEVDSNRSQFITGTGKLLVFLFVFFYIIKAANRMMASCSREDAAHS